MIIIIDTREQNPLSFKSMGVEEVVETLPVGDYTAKGQESEVVIERKELGDLWTSYSTGYDRERAKILKAKESGIQFVLAVEGTCWQLRSGFQFWNGKELITHKKDGLSMIRQLMTVSRKYGIQVWFCDGRRDMAFRIKEYLLSKERIKK